ncbi:MAG: sigma-70 family RNA polymerase sigma factor [Defluviitaleaceae bacterium]|nr:sigma-70 family RNA polymerase sigma factor [Defluviitaleaceae bacterium]
MNERSYEMLNQLVQQVQSGNPQAFNEIYQRCSGYVSFVCAKICDSKEDVEEIVQDTFITAFKKVDDLRGETLIPYLRTIAVHASFRKHKANNRRLAYTTEEMPVDLQELNQNLLPEAAMQNKELRKILINEIDKLPRQQREAMFLFYYADIPAKQIAESMEVPIGSIYTALTRARQTIKARMEENRKTEWVKAGAKAVALLPVVAIFLAEEATYMAAYVPTEFVGAAGATAATATFVGTSTVSSTVVGYIMAACIAAASVLAISAYVALQAEPPPEAEPTQRFYYMNTAFPIEPTHSDIEAPLPTQPPTTPTLASPTPTTAPEVMPIITTPIITMPPVTTPPETTTPPTTPSPTTLPPTTPTPTAPPIVNRTDQILSALANATTPAAVAQILADYDFTFDIQIDTQADAIIRFYITNEGSGEILVGTVTPADGTPWRMQYAYFESGQAPQDRFDLYLWIRS